MKNKKAIAKRIVRWLKKHHMDSDVAIFFSNKCWRFDSSGIMTIDENVKGSEYFEYANDKTISMTFEGPLYEALNMHYGYSHYDSFNEINTEGYYFEMGHAWNLAYYK